MSHTGIAPTAPRTCGIVASVHAAPAVGSEVMGDEVMGTPVHPGFGGAMAYDANRMM